MKKNILIILWLFLPFLCNSQTITLYTPNGSVVYASIKAEMSPEDIILYTKMYRAMYPEAEVLDSVSYTYNCHSYAWNMVEGGPVCWINYPQAYWTDGSYGLTIESNAEKIFYYDDDHSAIQSTTHPDKYISKWGQLPLMRHSPEYGPYAHMENRRYYRRCLPNNFTNQNVTSDVTIVHCSDINVQNVTVTNNAKLKLETSKAVIITSGFEVKAGSELQIK